MKYEEINNAPQILRYSYFFSPECFHLTEDLIGQIVEFVNEELKARGVVDPVLIRAISRRSECPIYWIKSEETGNCMPTTLLYEAGLLNFLPCFINIFI